MTVARVLVADRDNLVCEAMCAMLTGVADIEVVGAASSTSAMVEMAKSTLPSVVLMDMAIAAIDTENAIRELRQVNSDIKVLVLSSYEERDDILRGLKAGSNGYLPKRARASELVSAINAVSQGGYFLYPSVAKKVVNEYVNLRNQPSSESAFDLLNRNEQQMVKLIASGYTSHEMADALGVSPSTVARKRMSILTKLGLRNQADLVKYAVRAHLVDPAS